MTTPQSERDAMLDRNGITAEEFESTGTRVVLT